MIGAIWIYFCQVGSFRHLNYETGFWDTAETAVFIFKRGLEIIYLKVGKPYFAPYRVPRWEGMIPSA